MVCDKPMQDAIDRVDLKCAPGSRVEADCAPKCRGSRRRLVIRKERVDVLGLRGCECADIGSACEKGEGVYGGLGADRKLEIFFVVWWVVVLVAGGSRRKAANWVCVG